MPPFASKLAGSHVLITGKHCSHIYQAPRLTVSQEEIKASAEPLPNHFLLRARTYPTAVEVSAATSLRSLKTPTKVLVQSAPRST